MRPALGLILLFFALFACKKAGTQPPQNSGATSPAPSADAGVEEATASDAPAPVTIECDGDAGLCDEKAAEACPNGYDEVERSESPVETQKRMGAPAAEILKPKITRPGGNPPPAMRLRLTVRCREPAPTEAGADGAVPDAAAGDAATTP